MKMNSEKQYIDLYHECRQQICDHSADAMNAVRDNDAKGVGPFIWASLEYEKK